MGIVAAKVEYTKLSGGRGIAVIQGGADLFLRTVSFLETNSQGAFTIKDISSREMALAH